MFSKKIYASKFSTRIQLYPSKNLPNILSYFSFPFLFSHFSLICANFFFLAQISPYLSKLWMWMWTTQHNTCSAKLIANKCSIKVTIPILSAQQGIQVLRPIEPLFFFTMGNFSFGHSFSFFYLICFKAAIKPSKMLPKLFTWTAHKRSIKPGGYPMRSNCHICGRQV